MAILTILADDLSGAADCGLQAARRGLRTLVSLAPPDESGMRGTDVLAWDLDTRAAGAASAFERTYAAARSVARDSRLYIKLDSSLRGNLGAAVDAGLSVTGAGVAVVAPAFPALGRTTAGGRHRIAAPGSPRRAVTIDLVALLREQSRHAVVSLSLERLRAGAAGAVVAGLEPPGPWVIACDAEDERDLDLVVAALAGRRRDVVWAGSAGLAAALIGAAGGAPARRDAVAPAAGGPVLVVAGSTAPETLAQVDALLRSSSTAGVAARAAALAGDETAARAEVSRAASALGELLDAGRDSVLHAPGHAGDAPAGRARIARGLGETVRLAARHGAPGALVLTGGETARSVCQALGIAAIELVGELEPGIPAGRAAGTGVPIVTKAGAFGTAGSLLRARDALRRSAECPVP
jgi:uncharacterized protein YgbK (DUF1537 family)